MVKLYDTLHRTALRLIKKYGYNKAKYIRQLETTESWNNDFTTEEKIVDIIVLPSSKYSKETNRIQGNKDMLDHNYVAYMPHSDFIPNINDYFTVNGVNYTVLSMVRINPNGKDIIYKLELK